jgi:hypothetical protein
MVHLRFLSNVETKKIIFDNFSWLYRINVDYFEQKITFCFQGEIFLQIFCSMGNAKVKSALKSEELHSADTVSCISSILMQK